MKVKKLLALAMIAGLVVGSVNMADAKKKKKKKKKPVPVQADATYYMRADACDGEETDNLRLSLEDGPDAGNVCGWLNNGLLNTAAAAAGEPETPVINVTVAKDVWPVADGLPLTLDASKPLTGTLNLRSAFHDAAPDNGLSVGEAKLEISFTGVSGGEELPIGNATVTYTVTPQASNYAAEFEIDLVDELDKKVLESLSMTTAVHGNTLLHGSFEMDDPASTVIVPTWVLKKK